MVDASPDERLAHRHLGLSSALICTAHPPYVRDDSEPVGCVLARSVAMRRYSTSLIFGVVTLGFTLAGLILLPHERDFRTPRATTITLESHEPLIAIEYGVSRSPGVYWSISQLRSIRSRRPNVTGECHCL